LVVLKATVALLGLAFCMLFSCAHNTSTRGLSMQELVQAVAGEYEGLSWWMHTKFESNSCHLVLMAGFRCFFFFCME
jgi:hypothetical protein